MKLLIGLLLLGAIGSLFSGLFFLVKDSSSSNRTAKALTFRVGFSVALILLVIILLATGHLELNPTPH
ncbi:hypothetical protein BTA51_12425 [Hahella sp. CCB-MM4]|uniref:twin transmembrane helix small protein n=1 Tax=Hahella sp. (strain CCB-MM4) TaxID=1926491 RepID=UPI000B9C5A01|nr:twin transmembrane helix small protein [Hahella sp. CCB-MM4]OZG73275.1 hypothetical protein BTA51_12425 [Hahella sp. CCB-MM4]